MAYEDYDSIIAAEQYKTHLQREIDEAYWLGEEEDVQHLVLELECVKDAIENGDVYYPLF